MSIRLNAFLLFCSLLIIGCASSGTQQQKPNFSPDRPDGTQPEPGLDESVEVYAQGRVVTPVGSTGVAGAEVSVRSGGRDGNPIATTLADSTGRFRIFDPLTCSQCWFVARDNEENIEGSTTVEVPEQEVPSTIYVELGREGLELTPFDSTDADPGSGWGRSRSGGK